MQASKLVPGSPNVSKPQSSLHRDTSDKTQQLQHRWAESDPHKPVQPTWSHRPFAKGMMLPSLPRSLQSSRVDQGLGNPNTPYMHTLTPETTPICM